REEQLVKSLEELIPSAGKTLVPPLSAEALRLFAAFVDETRTDNYPYRDCLDRVLNMIRIDVLMRTVFSGAGEIHAQAMERAIAWGRHQLVLRSQLWPADRGSKVEVMEHCIL